MSIPKSLILILIFFCTHSAYGQTANEYFQKARELATKEDYKGALKKVDKAMELGATDTVVFYLKDKILFKLKKYQELYEFYNLAIDRFPDYYRFYYNRGNLLLEFREYDLSIRDFTTTIKLTNQDTILASAYSNRAAAKMWQRNFDDAYKDLLLAYQLDSTNIFVLTNLGAVADEIGRGDETLTYLKKVIDINPSYVAAYVNIGFKYQELGDHRQAIDYFTKALELDPNEPLGYSNRSFNKLKIGDLKGAMKDIEKSIKLGPENSYAYRIRALIHVERGKMGQACDDLQTALDKGFTTNYGDEVLELQKKYCQ
ncbi:MAG: tetratricopeptide repeat protein [Bacteroidota bacterium]